MNYRRFLRFIFYTFLLLELPLSSVFGQFQTRFTDLHFNYAIKPSVAWNTTDYVVPALGVGLGVNIGKEHFASFFEYNYRYIYLKRLNNGTKGLHEHVFFLGLRYFPLKPTFITGKTAFRISAAAALGLDLQPNWRGMFMLGMFFSPVLSTSGFAIHTVYYPSKYSLDGYSINNRWELRFSIIAGASAE